MKRPSYKQAIEWIVDMDDCYWVQDENPIASVTACMVADLFDVDLERVKRDIAKLISTDAARRLSN